MILHTQTTSYNPLFSETPPFPSFSYDLTMDQWFQIWLNDYKINNVKPTTRQIYEDLYKCQIKQPLGNLPISQIRPLHIQRMYNQFMSKGLSSKYLHNVNAVLYNLFDVAVRNDLISKNPCDGVIKPPIDAIERRVLTSQEQIRFLRFIRQNRWSFYEPTLTVLLGTGLRVGELLALNWEDINFEQKTISITKTLVYVKDRDTKNSTSLSRPQKQNTESGSSRSNGMWLLLYEGSKRTKRRSMHRENGLPTPALNDLYSPDAPASHSKEARYRGC